MTKLNALFSTLFLLTAASSFAETTSCKIRGADGEVVASLKVATHENTYTFEYMEKYTVGEEQRTFTTSNKDQGYSCEKLDESADGFACTKSVLTSDNKTKTTYLRIARETDSSYDKANYQFSIGTYIVDSSGTWVKAGGGTPWLSSTFYDCVTK